MAERRELRQFAFPLAALGLPLLAVAAGVVPVLYLGIAGSRQALDSYTWGVVRFTLLQAGLSTLLSLLIGVALGRALVRRTFYGRTFFLRLLSLPLALPAIVAALGIITIFGTNGILGGLIPLFGLTGILLAHVFFNFPVVARVTVSTLEQVPEESYRLAAQLGFTDRDYWTFIDWPALRTTLPGAALLVFLLCAASFTIVLTLGGGPAATTLEVAIYQSLRFDFDPARAAVLGAVQFVLFTALASLALLVAQPSATLPRLRRRIVRNDGHGLGSRLLDACAIAAGMCLLLPPLGAVVWDGLCAVQVSNALYAALATSLLLGSASALLALSLCWPMTFVAARSAAGSRISLLVALSGMMLPPAVIATGWFLLFGQFAGLRPALVIALNALMALPFAYAVLAPAVSRHLAATDGLCASLAINGFSRFRLIDFPALSRPASLSLALAAIVSLGDLTAIMLFGTDNFQTLPALIYAQMGSYRTEAASGTALVLAVLALGLLLLTERLGEEADA